jgi:hypothetical protein
VRFAKVGGAELPRAELTLNAGTERETRVHLYEAYWAPLTEGLVTLRDVMRFLWRGANNGVENARGAHGFHRYMFGGIVSFGQQTGALWQLIFTTVVLGALVLLNAVATGVFAAAFLGKSGSVWREPALTGEVTLIVASALCAGVACVLAMYTAQKMAFFFALLASLVLAAVGVTVATIAALGWDTAFALPGWLAWMNSLWWTALFWGGLCFASYKIRGVLVQYVGDVAAYVTPHTLDRFYELRQKIKKSMRDVADPVYADVQPDGKPTYARVAIVGHSLGSVAAYDVLNAMINSDALATRTPVGVLERTCILLTFGSPLDKTAFIFNAQGHDTGILREALGAAVQPLIQDAKYRVFPWVNVYSPADIISGALDLYDPPRSASSAGGLRVTNLADPEARRPIWAHTQYWGTKIVFDQLHAAVAGVPLKSVGTTSRPSSLVM